MFLKSVTLKNLQRHKRLKIFLCPGFNCISGGNMAGKSSIVRAVNWCLDNKPVGDWMNRLDTKGNRYTSSVLLSYDDKKIKRVKGKGINYYKVNGVEYHDFGSNVPQEVREALKYDNPLLKDYKLSPAIRLQEDNQFLVYDTTRTKAGAINVLSGIDVVEKAIKSFNRDRLNKKKELSSIALKLQQYRQEYKKYKFLKEIKLSKITKLEESILKVETLRDKISGMYNKRNELRKVVAEYSGIYAYYKQLLKIEEKAFALSDMIKHKAHVETTYSLYKNLGNFKPVPVIDFESLYLKLNKISEFEEKHDKIGNMLVSRNTLKSAIKHSETDSENTIKELSKYKGSKCPICNNIIKDLVIQ